MFVFNLLFILFGVFMWIAGKTARVFREGAQTCLEHGYGKMWWQEFLSQATR